MNDVTAPERRDALAQDIWTGSLVLLSYVFFCILALLQPDEMTLKDTGVVEMPFAHVGVNFLQFELFGSLVLLLILIYLHYLLNEWRNSGGGGAASAGGGGQRFFFNRSTVSAQIVSLVIFYVSGPFVLAWFVFKIRAWANVWIWEVVLCYAAAFFLCLLVWRDPISSRRKQICLRVSPALVLLGILFPMSWPHFLADRFPLDLENADLSGRDLKYYFLRNVRAYGANLKGADLSGQLLQQANFSFANLERADFTDADLAGADFNHAHLEDADFYGAGLKAANFSRAFLAGADLTKARLQKANFTRARMQVVDWQDAVLTEVTFQRTNLSEAKNLDQAQLAGLCGDSTTIKTLPSYLVLKNCP
jgi:hypothetical protein